MNKGNEEILKRCLLNGNVVLFLGAGFSYGSENEQGVLPKGKELQQEIFDKFVKGKVATEEEKELQEYNLQDLCQCVYDYLNKQEELKDYILSRFKRAKPKEYHLLLTTYDWKRIYTVNVDDLVENIFATNGVACTVQNTRSEKKHEVQVELIKLHGCVNAPEEPITFSKSEYTTLIKDKNYKLDKLSTDMVDRDVIFVGASMEESDIDFYVSKYESAGFLRKGKLIFIDPYPSVKLKARISALKGILLQWNTEQFLQFVAALKYNPTDLEKSKKMLNYSGLFLYRDIVGCFSSGDIYESRLYEGYGSNWKDVVGSWIFKTSDIKSIQSLCEQLDWNDYSSYCIAIFGPRFAGKDCALKLLGAHLYKQGYEVIEYKGKSLDLNALAKYIFASEYEKFVLLIENASYYYGLIEKLLQFNWQGRKLLILSTSRTYYHYRKKYYLEDNPYVEYEVKDRIARQDTGVIYDKLVEKGYLGDLSRKKEEGLAQIFKKGSFINLFTDLTYGNGFRRGIKDVIKNIYEASDTIKSLYMELVLFDKADLPYYPSELLVQQYSIDFNVFANREYEKLDKEQRLIVDYIRIENNGIVLKNRLLVDAIWERVKEEEKIQTIKIVLNNIASYISENENNYWRIIFESLLKEDILSKVFKIRESKILELYYGLKDSFEEISYYWLQLGIAEQKNDDYAKALNHLKMAQKIRPNAYQIQHAIARNYLQSACVHQDFPVSKELFVTGERMMMDLINSRESYKAKAKHFSIHCYVHEKIRYMSKYPELLNKKDVLSMKQYMDQIIGDNDDYSNRLVVEFVSLLKKNNLLSAITLKPGDVYFKALSHAQNRHQEKGIGDEADVLIDSY